MPLTWGVRAQGAAVSARVQAVLDCSRSLDAASTVDYSAGARFSRRRCPTSAPPSEWLQWYLDHYGCKGVTQGIILETDGHPQVGFNSGNQWNTNAAYTCKAALAAATAAKADTTNTASDPTLPQGIQIVTVGYGVDRSSLCPAWTSNLNDSNNDHNTYEDPAWSSRPATELLSAMATDSSHSFENSASADLAVIPE